MSLARFWWAGRRREPWGSLVWPLRLASGDLPRSSGRPVVATIRSLLRDRVTLQVRSVDRIFLQGYVPRLMSEGLLVRFLLDRGFTLPSPSLLGQIGRGYVAAVERFAADGQIPLIRF